MSDIIGSSNGTFEPNVISKYVTGVGVVQNLLVDKTTISGFILHFDDTTTAEIGPVDPLHTEFKSEISKNFAGLNCELHEDHKTADVFINYGCHVYDELCTGQPFDDREIADMSAEVSLSSEQDATFFIE